MAAPKRPSRQGATVPKGSARQLAKAAAPRQLPAPPPPETTLIPIVGIGASAGGLEALETFFSHMPDDSGIAFIVVTHMDPHATSFLPDLLGRTTNMHVREAMHGQRLEPNEVIITSPGKALRVEQGILQLSDIEVPHGFPLPIDTLFRSLAEDQEERAIGIILSGTGTDGTLGAKAIKHASGMVMAQSAQSAKFAGMPQSVAAAGLADYIESPEQMPAELLTYVRGPYLLPSGGHRSSPAIVPEVLQDILSLVYAHTGHSFSSYKISTIRRRIERRLNLHQIAAPDQYMRYVREHPDEIDHLFHDLLIGVTSFFRDPDAFETFANTALPELLATKADSESMRVWVAGCSTGEEAYSLAIVLREVLERLHKSCPVQIFATDLDTHAIDTARLGLYPEGIAADVSPERLARFFTHDHSTYQVGKEIREMVVFAPHNVLADPPFTRLDVVACRNLLIYLDPNAQQQLLTLFHYALRPGGLLFLGSSETIGNLGNLFSTQNRQWKIFTRHREAVVPYILPEHAAVPFYLTAGRTDPDASKAAHASTPSRRAEAYLAQRYAPPSVLITPRGDIVHFHGRTGAYLEPPRGQPNLNIFSMAREGLERVLAPAIRVDQVQEAPVVRYGVKVKTNGSTVDIDVLVERVAELGPLQGLLLVTFRPTATAVTALAADPPMVSAPLPRRRRRVADLEQELLETRKSLQSTIEELEASNETLTSTNEELQSTNEEMQSANEELKTSKEEMQSLNEELQTVNAELNGKVNELAHTNDDMTNLLNSTDVGTIFLDLELRIKRFTPQATQVMALIPSDVGRPISDLTSNLDYLSLTEDACEVLRTLRVQEREVRTKDGGTWYLVRILPYRTADNVIDGLVITFVNINMLKSAETGRQHAEDRLATEIAERQFSEVRLLVLSKVFMEATVPIILEDSAGHITDLNTEAEQAYGWRREELIGQPIKTLIPPEYHQQTDDLLERCRRGDNLRQVESFRLTKSGEVLPTLLTVSPLSNDKGDIMGIATIAQHPLGAPHAQRLS